MIIGLTVILLCQLLGEVVARGLGWPLPGPVLGMLFLLVFLSLRDSVAKKVPELGKTLDSTGKGLLAHLSLLFIPASVGVVQRLDVLADYGTGLARRPRRIDLRDPGRDGGDLRRGVAPERLVDGSGRGGQSP